MSPLNQLKTRLSNLKLNCEYWDVRVEDSFSTSIGITDGEVVSCTASPSLGAFIRLRKDGFWFYEATTELESILTILQKLCAKEVNKKGKDLFEVKKQKSFLEILSLSTQFRNVSMIDKLKLVENYAKVLKQFPKINSAQLRYQDIYKTKSFFNSVGTEYEYDFNQAGIMVWYTLKEDSYLFEDGFRRYGAQFSELENGLEDLKNAICESEKFIQAPAIEPGKYKILLDPEVAGVFTHESFGHKSEADFMLGNQQALEEWQIGKTIAASCLNIVDYGGHKNTSGYCPVDDEGTPAQKNYLIKAGVLAGRLHSLETAFQLNESPTGNARAIGFEWEPLVRMTSTYIEPGTESAESIISRSEGAILVEGVKHGSGLSTFTIAPNRGYRIGFNGAKHPVRITVISGSVFETLKNIESVSSEFNLCSSALGGCGKMDQWPLPVADGGPYVLIKEMQVS
jgi:TldD protein